jgi:hypothetical protein
MSPLLNAHTTAAAGGLVARLENQLRGSLEHAEDRRKVAVCITPKAPPWFGESIEGVGKHHDYGAPHHR